MATATYTPIATTTLGSAQNTISFTSIPSTYTDLRIVCVVPDNGSTLTTTDLQFNSSTTTVYSYTYLSGDGSSAASGTSTGVTSISTSAATTKTYMATFDIFSYAGSTHKSILYNLSSDQNGTGNVYTFVGLWRNTAAITTIDVRAGVSADKFPINTTATLYGILKA